jgi:hypothetical protein
MTKHIGNIPTDLDGIPYGKERAILAKMVLDLRHMSNDGFVKAGITGDIAWVVLVLYWATLNGKALSANKIAVIAGVPRETTRRHLAALMHAGFAQCEGCETCGNGLRCCYRLSEHRLKSPATDVPTAAKIVLRAAEELIAAQNGHKGS